MCSSDMGPQAARAADEEGTSDIQHRLSFAPNSHPSNSSHPTNKTDMSLRITSSSKPNPRDRREAQSSDSSSASKATPSVWSPGTTSPKASTPQSPESSIVSTNTDSVDLGALNDHLELLKDELASDALPSSQYLLVRRIPGALFQRLEQEPELLKGVRATILHREQEVLCKVMPRHYHEKITRHFDGWLIATLRAMGLRTANKDFWLGGAGRSTGRMASKEADSAFFPGRAPAGGAPVPWPSLVLEVGLSESVRQLRTDARWWYFNSGCQTRLAVLVSANANSHDADIEIWTEVINQRVGARTRGLSTHSLQRTMSASIRDGVVFGDALELDFQTMMGRSPQAPQEMNLLLTPPDLLDMCD
ncbi:hypothetical protein N7492_008558 [Penicillium capsulatum]|uniref:Uncharacterized protein n=1 Tax=Penicillium capsulatum TaxID=69766 RepID=A0A9W9LHE0_9EURO|nr:hypothetical protein N7492_008558 [Penicillium capsulatum]